MEADVFYTPAQVHDESMEWRKKLRKITICYCYTKFRNPMKFILED